jgi:isoquinoline 1-oxidoreductase subunit alpha
MVKMNVNGKTTMFDGDPDTPILWVLRDHLDVTSPKFGCGMALCGACTVHLDGAPIRSCSIPVSAAAGKAWEGIARRVDCRGSTAMRLLPDRPNDERRRVD